MRCARIPTVLAALLLLASLAPGQVVQTIVIDGVNDFDPANLLDDDGGDTQYDQLDIGNVYVTNDANNLYLGFGHDQGSWSSVQLGVAIDVNTAIGGNTDPWSRQLEWSGAATRPDFIYYINLDSSWQASYEFNPGPGIWVDIVAGPNALGVPMGTDFREYAISLASLGVGTGDVVNVECWITQDGPTKGPFDAAANDAVQLSTPESTTFDVTDPVPMTLFHSFTVLDATDNTPPTVLQAGMEGDAEVFVRYSEPVDPSTAEVAGNYSLPGATVTAAMVDESQPDLVHLELAADLPIAADAYTLSVAGVTDLAGNPIGEPSSSSFLWKQVTFLGHMSRYLENNSTPPDGFTVEGGTWPLTWTLCDNAQMDDLGGGDFQWSGRFWGPAEGGSFEWKFVHNCATYEPQPGNRVHTLAVTGSDTDLIDVWWGDEDPTQFTVHDIDVLFFVDMNAVGPQPGDVLGLAGNVAPLDQEWPPAQVMVDDGTGIDETAGDGIYSLAVRFPADSYKFVTYKFRLNEEYECFGQGDREVVLNDEEFDIIGGDLGPLALPEYVWDFCTLNYRDLEVIFRLDATNVAHVGHVFAVNGTRSNEEPPAFSWDIPSLNPLADDGIAPDETAGDGIFAVSVVFPAGSEMNTEYKYLMDDEYEGFLGNRNFQLNPYDHDAEGNPQVRDDQLQSPVAVDDLPAARLTELVNVPNPFNPSTEIRFTVHRAGQGSLRVYDAQGRLVRTLHAGTFAVGPQIFTWDGRDDAGQGQASGVYLYRLEVDGQVGARKMLLVK
jgi:hypothetical protein